MFELKTKQITRWGLTIQGEDIYFPTKRMAINIGKSLISTSPDAKMFEEYRLWDSSYAIPKLIDEQRFDRAILIQ